jgi:hypothetical protein
LHLCGAPPSGAAPAIPFGGLIAASPRSEVRQSWLQVQDFGVSRPCLAFTSSHALTGQLSSCAWKLQMKARAKNRCHAPMILVRAARVFDHGPIRVTWRCGQPFRPIPGGGTLPVSPRLASTESGRLHPPKGQITILLIFGVFKNTKPAADSPGHTAPT